MSIVQFPKDVVRCEQKLIVNATIQNSIQQSPPNDIIMLQNKYTWNLQLTKCKMVNIACWIKQRISALTQG